MKLVSLDEARSRERAKSPSTTPTSPNPPFSNPLSQSIAGGVVSSKTVKSKKSGFLKLFKYKDDALAPAVPRGSFEDSSTAVVGNRSVSSPTDFRRGEALTMLPARAAHEAAAPGPSTAHQLKGRSDAGDSTLVIKQQSLSEPSRRANASAPPTMAIVQPSPDLSENQAPFSPPDLPLPAPPVTGSSKAKRSLIEAQEGLAPSLSLRPVSMMFASMPQAFLADLQAAESTKTNVAKAGISPSSLSSDSLTSPTAARTPDTPSFVFFDPDNIVTPPANAAHTVSKAPFGLPTPPHSASSSRTGYPGLPKPPSSPSLSQHESAHAAVSTAAYRARILVLEKQVAVLQARLATAAHNAAAPVESEKILLEAADVESPTSVRSSSKVSDFSSFQSGRPQKLTVDCRPARNADALAKPAAHNQFSPDREPSLATATRSAMHVETNLLVPSGSAKPVDLALYPPASPLLAKH